MIMKNIIFLVRASDKRIVNEAEYSDSEDEGEGRRDEKSYKTPRKKIKPGSPIASMVIDSIKPIEKEASKQHYVARDAIKENG